MPAVGESRKNEGQSLRETGTTKSCFLYVSTSERFLGLRETQLSPPAKTAVTPGFDHLLGLHSPACLLLLPQALMGRALSLGLPVSALQHLRPEGEPHPAQASASSFSNVPQPKNRLPVPYSCFLEQTGFLKKYTMTRNSSC